ncbi:uncharacterized protein LOC110441444 [Mizuhopecten yessoensis]|uniref:Palladin n=1 Tax=Mizuhopecten yessoensis TaxID=6573 RepID=A0A210PJK8_MIZYE|nr:uncharacterized protein LOC110441444 [Mizuhopecten yessoensis]OWF36606.1 Palladin [Mizuhopecten yessoensis]
MESHFISRITLCCFAVLFGLTDAGQICGSCSLIVEPRDCDVVTECGDHEECLVVQYLTPAGLKRYDIGCESSFRCYGMGKRSDNSTLDLSGEKKSLDNKIPLCKTCCNSTKMCNTIDGLCNSKPLMTYGALICYNCEQMEQPDRCDRIKLCGIDNQCYIGRKQNDLSGLLLWESRCGENATECKTITANNALAIIGKKRQIGNLCTSCCANDRLCNNQCGAHTHVQPQTQQPTQKPTTQRPTHAPTHPTTPRPTHEPTHKPHTTTHRPTTPSTHTTRATTTPTPLSKPVITFVTRLHDVKKGSYVHLTCRATGNPTPSIAWNFFALGDVTPTNVRVANNGADIYIDSVTDMNYGHYACKAHNSEGDDTRYIDILEHGPSGP